MTQENKISTLRSITNVEGVFDVLGARAVERDRIITNIHVLQEQLKSLGVQIQSERQRDLVSISELAVAAAKSERDDVVSFAKELIVAVASNEGSDKLIDIREKYKNLDLTGLVPSEFTEHIDIKPELLRIVQGSTVKPGWLEIPDQTPLIEAEVVDGGLVKSQSTDSFVSPDSEQDSKTIETETTKVLYQLAETKYPVLMDLLTNDSLWVNGKNDRQYTSFRNISALIISGEINEKSLSNAYVNFLQTVKPAWNKKTGTRWNGITIDGYPRLKFISKEDACDLIVFMHSYYENSKSPKHITDQPSIKWPFVVESKKKLS